MLPEMKIIATKGEYKLTRCASYGFNSNTLTASWEISNNAKTEFYSFIRLKDAKEWFAKLEG